MTSARNLRPVGVAGAVVVAAVVALTARQWGTIFADDGQVLPVVAAAVIAALVVVVAVARALPAWVSFAAAGVITLGVAAIGYGADIGELPGDLVHSWKDLGSTGLLLPTTPPLVLVPVLVAGVGSWMAAELVVRRHLPAAAALPLLGAHAVAAAYTVGLGQPPWWSGVAIVAGVALLLFLEGLDRPGGVSFGAAATGAEEAPRRIAAGASVVSGVASVLVVAAVAAAITAPGVRGDQPFDLRDRLVRPVHLDAAASPLAGLKAGLLDDANTEVFTIRLDGMSAEDSIDLVPVAVLDDYDGSVWATSATFEAAGSVLPSPTQGSLRRGDELRQTVELSATYPFAFLPRAGELSAVTGTDLAWDPATGMLVRTGNGAGSFAAVVVTTPPPPEEPTELGGVPSGLEAAAEPSPLTDAQRDAFNAYLAEVVDPDADPLVQLRSIEADLRSERFGYNATAPAGHSLAALTSFVSLSDDTPDGSVVGRVGFAEQSSAVLAVLARHLGAASRVVVGYRLSEPLTAANPERVVRAAQIHAWTEVWVTGHGWVRFDPTNPANETPELAPRVPAVSSEGLAAGEADLPDVQAPVLLADDAAASSGRSPWWWLLVVPAALALVAGAVVAAKALRRARRRRGSADERIIGAWHETRDRLRDLRLPAADSRSPAGVADGLATIDLRDVGEPIAEMAPTVDVALYSPRPADDAHAVEAWRLVDAALGAARKSVPVRRRAIAVLDPRTLVRR